MHQWNIWYGKPMGNHTVLPCYTSMAKIALWQMFSRQLQQEVGCILCSLSKVEELGFFHLKIVIGLCPWSFETRKFPTIVNFALNVYL